MPAQVVIETDGPSQKKRAKRIGIQRSLAEKKHTHKVPPSPTGHGTGDTAKRDLISAAYIKRSPHGTQPQRQWRARLRDRKIASITDNRHALRNSYPDVPAVTISTTHPIRVSSLIFTSPNISLTAANALLPLSSPSLSLSSVCASLVCWCCC